MANPPGSRKIDFRRYDDALHQSLNDLEDLRWGSWWMRCVEFHFTQGNCTAGEHFDWHLHKELQCEIILSGEFSFSVRGAGKFSLKRGDVLILPPDLPHRWQCIRSGVMLGASYAIVPRADSLSMSAGAAKATLKLTPPSLPLLLDGLIEEGTTSVTDGRFSLKRLSCWIYLISTSILGEDLLSSLGANLEADESDLPRSHRIVSKLIRFIDANLDGDLSMQRLEKAAGLGARQIHRIFFEVTGVSCHRYLMDRRLEVARSKLQNNPSLSIKEVAYECGFTSPSHFSTNFKKAFGTPPNEYSGKSK